MELSAKNPIVFTKKIKTLHINIVSTHVFTLITDSIVIQSTTTYNLDNNYLDYSAISSMSIEEAQSLINILIADSVSTK